MLIRIAYTSSCKLANTSGEKKQLPIYTSPFIKAEIKIICLRSKWQGCLEIDKALYVAMHTNYDDSMSDLPNGDDL